MAITAADVKKLREQSGAGMMDCKKALNENNGDFEAAVDWLRTKGLSAAAKKSGRVAAEGLVVTAVAGNKGVVVEVNSETDFVSRNEQFQEFVANIGQVGLTVGGSDIEAVKNAEYPGAGHAVTEELTKKIATIGENMSLRRIATREVGSGVVVPYVHNAAAPNMGKIGVLVALESSADAGALQELGKKLAMHIAAAAPQAVRVEELDQNNIERERSVYAEQAKESGKPDNIIEKMVEGRLRKFYEEVVLLQQAFVMDTDQTIQQVVEAAGKDAGADITIAGFERFVLGEGIEKEETDFAAEVQQQLAG